MEEAFRVSTAIAQSGLAPKGLDRPEQILVAIMAGAELGLAPFQSLQSFAVVNGRPTLWGDGLMAVARSGGVRVREWIEGEGDRMIAHCEVTRPDGEVIPRRFSVADAKKAGLWGKAGPWQNYPQRMLAMRARAWALRDGCADMLRGFQVREEVEDYEGTTSEPARRGTGMRARYEARQIDRPNGGFDAAHVEGELSEVQTAEFEDHEPLKACEVCGAADGVECADSCSTWDALDPESWPDGVRAYREANRGEPVATLDLADDEFDAEAWAVEFNRCLGGLKTVEAVAQAWERAKAEGKLFRLKAKNEAMAQALAADVNARIAEIKAAK
jgi:hypothetical protein